ncbi:hypothetical protein [Streptomyces sp. NBC_01320]|uniref:hypothetical protein n=1 Tax=Streptomyces sp. NBC_01320 TaxID=2903824 RepID=UPI002E0EDC68|nr:hypothetical protein OG395_56040 [Streptomyces sp. NBC_01320]
MENKALDEFLAAAVSKYQLITPDEPIPCFALLLGSVDGTTFTVERVAFACNARNADPAARREFAESIVPRFGPAYENETRGWWIDSRDLLRVAREAEADGLEILGSIHMHPDWHRIGPPAERGFTLSEHPTPMDQHVFVNTAWPVNLICYLERRGDVIFHALAAWAPPAVGGPGARCSELPLRVRTNVVAGV